MYLGIRLFFTLYMKSHILPSISNSKVAEASMDSKNAQVLIALSKGAFLKVNARKS